MKGQLTHMNTPDPLKDFYGKPLIGEKNPNIHYVGRIIVELYESPEIRSDAAGLAYIIDPSSAAEIDEKALLVRIATALQIHADKG